MIKKTVTYEDFNGQTRTDDFYFNLTKAELVELEVSEKDGFVYTLKEIAETKNAELIIANFKKIILLAIGEKSADGKNFRKSDNIRADFQSSGAYPELFMELATDANAAVAFMNGIIPANLAKEIAALSKSEEVQEEHPRMIKKSK